MYIGEKTFFTVPFLNARKAVRIPLEMKDFKPNGKGLPWICGISNAINRHKALFGHPVLYAHTIGSAVYIVAASDKGGMPKWAFRYNHRKGALVSAYDESRKDASKLKKFSDMLEKYPYMILEKGRAEQGREHRPRTHNKHPYGMEQNRQGIVGARRRAVAAGLFPDGLAL